MEKKYIGTIIAVVVALLLGAYGTFRSAPEKVIERVIERQQNLGALTGPDIPSPWLRWGNKITYRLGLAATSGTTTVCKAQGPAATSSVTTTFSITTATSSSLTWALSTSTRAQGYATTSPYFTRDLLASKQNQFMSIPTENQNNTVPPNGWVTLSAYGAGSGGTANDGIVMEGNCTFEFQVF